MVQEAGFSLTKDQAAAVTQALRSAETALGRAQGALRGDPVIGLLEHLPVIGTQIAAAAGMTEAAELIASRHEETGEILSALIVARDSGTGAQRFAALARVADEQRASIESLIEAIQAADRRVASISTEGLIGPVASARAAAGQRFAQLGPLVSGASDAVQLVPSLMGVGTTQRYLVLALDDAELRPIGGLIGAYAVPSFADGVLSDITFHDILSIDKRNQYQYVKPPEALADHLLGDATWQVADAGWSPDFAESAKAARTMYRIETGDADIQGTIAFTPELVDALLGIVGPVAVPSAGITIHAGETYLVSLEQVEVLNRGEGRKQFLADLASTVIDRLFALPESRYPEIVAALAEAARRRHLQILFDDPAVQASLARLGWYSPFGFVDGADRLALIEANVAPVSKLDVLLTLDHALDVVLQPDGSAIETLVTTFTNGYSHNLPPELERVRSSFSDGNLGSYHRRYLSPSADIISVSSNNPGSPVTDADSIDAELGSLVVGNYQFIRPGSVSLETTYSVPNVVVAADADADVADAGTYCLSYRKQAGRDRDTLQVRVTVPEGTVPTRWSAGGLVEGPTVTFSVPTEDDRLFQVTYVTE